MSGSDRDSVYGLYPETLAIPAGATFHMIRQMPYQTGIVLKYLSGGSIMVVGPSFAAGSTYGISQGYGLGATEILQMPLSGPLYLQAVGTTSVLALLRTYSAGATFA
jgi:hypothetical protein